MSVRDRWMNGRQRTAAYGTGQRWEVRWRDAGDQQRKRRFPTKDAALIFDAAQLSNPQDFGVTVASLWESWIARRANLAPGTLASYRTTWRVHVEPRWGHLRAADVRRRDVELWQAGIPTPAVRRRATSLLLALLRDADVVLRVSPGQSPRRHVEPLNQHQLERLAAECAPHDLVVWVLATTGVRFGEMAALQVGDVHPERGRLTVARQLTTVDGRVVASAPKSGRARETVIPAWLVERLDLDRKPSAVLLPTSRGGPWRASSWKRVWSEHGETRLVGGKRVTVRVRGARERAELPGLRVHDLRHTFACRMIDAGVDLKSLQRMLGHASLSLTVDLYGARAQAWLDRAPDAFCAPNAPSPSRHT